MRISAPSRSDPVVRALSGVVGGPAGRRAAPGRGLLRALPVLVLLAVCSMALAVVQKAHCVQDGWSSPDQFWHACYSDIAVLYGSSGLGAADRPTVFQAVGVGAPGLGQPPLAGAAMWALSAVVDATPEQSAPRRFFLVSAVVLALVLVVAVVCVGLAAGRRRVWDAAHVAVAPILFTAALISYDLLAVAFVAAALLAWSRRRPVAAGVLLGLGVGCRPVVAILVVALLGACLRAGRTTAWFLCAITTAGTWVVLRLLLFPSPLTALSSTWQGWRDSRPGYGSIWLVPQLLQESRPSSARLWYSGPAFTGSATTTATLLGLLVVATGTVLLALGASYRPRVAHLGLVALAGTLLVTKSLPVQAPLLLLPLIALAGLRWRDHLIFATTEIIYFVAVWLYIGASSDANRGLPAGFYLILLLLRSAGIVWVAVQAVRASLDPTLDPVRVPLDPVEDADDDDPAGGVLDQASDALVIRLT